MRSGRPLNLELSLATNFIHGCFVGELGHKLIGLDVDVLFAWGSLRGLDITSEEFLGCLGSLCLEALRVILALVSLEKLVWVCASGDDHSGVGASSKHTLIVGNVLREVSLLTSIAIRVLIFLFLSNYARMCGEALRASTASGLLQHF